MTEIRKAGEVNALDNIDVPQGEFRSQIAALTDAVRQMGGNPNVAPGSSEVNDPLSAPYILYVNSYTGSDKFVSGEYASADDGTFEQKMRRISLQRLECGYTEARPFKTINRAAIEAGIITSKDYLDLPGNLCGDLVTIVVMSGVHDVINGPGSGSTSAWADGYEPDDADLQAFNAGDGGVVLPRGCSVVSMDLRKTNLRPTYVPAFDQEKEDFSNRSSIFRVTGTGYYYGFTFLDKVNYTESHHLLDTFSFAGRSRTDAFYAKILTSFGASSGVSTLARTRNSEVQIVGPQPLPGFQSETTDTVESASPYIYNCSIRSLYGMSGIFANGAEVEGFKSMVVAQYTAISMQKDMRCWQRYNSGAWGTINQADYDQYIDETPDNVRMDPRYRSIHIRCVNRAIIQEVSVFAIGQGIHHAVESGGELTVTNSNSNFGGCASLADGFVDYSFNTDKNWNVSEIQVSEDISGLFGNQTRISLGAVDGSNNNATTIKLEEPLAGSADLRPDVLAAENFSLDNYGGTNLIWAENPSGQDYYAPLADNAWTVLSPDEIKIAQPFQTADGETPDGTAILPDIDGLVLYVRRLRDTRTLGQRANTLLCSNTDTDSRNMLRDYGVQTDVEDAAIDREIDAEEPIIVANVGVTSDGVGGAVKRRNRIELRRAAASEAWDDRGEWNSAYHNTYRYYRQGDTVRYQNKHWKATEENSDSVFDPEKWDECLVHTEEEFAAEDYFKNVKPIITFDKDQDTTGEDPYLGYDPTDCFKDDEQVVAQHRTSVDYLGLYSFLRSLGFNDNRAHRILLPKPAAERDINPNSPYDGIPSPSGAANSWNNWAIQLRRPSNIRLFGHAFEWAGQLNYTKALPQYQRDLSASNKFSYFFTNSMGGRCYVSGFNEEGFGVSAAGLTDLQTGETLDPGGIGGDRDPNAFVVFNNLKVTGQLDAQQIINGQGALVRWLNDDAARPNGSPAVDNPTQGKGFGWIASFKNITGFEEQLQYQPKDIENQNTVDQYKGPNFVNAYYLDSWRVANRLVSSRTEPLYIFVNPRGVAPTNEDNPKYKQNESRNWNVNDIATVLLNPPDDPRNAVRSLQLAKEFADVSVSSSTPVVYFVGPGIYKHDIGTITFEHPTTIRPYDFSAATSLSDGKAGGTRPFMGTNNDGRGNGGRTPLQGNGLDSYLNNSDNHPVFITRIFANLVTGNRVRLRTTPLKFIFKKDSYVTGCVWWGVNETLRHMAGTRDEDDNNIGNGYHGGTDPLDAAAYEAIRGQTYDEIYNQWVYRWCQNSGRSTITFYSGGEVLETYGQLYVNNVAITAVALNKARSDRATDKAVFTCRTGGLLRLAGLYLIGNVILNDQGAGTPPSNFLGRSSFDQQAFANTLLSVDRDDIKTPLRFAFGGWNSINRGGGNREWNLTYNNWHLINNEYEYMPENLIATTTNSFGTAGDEGDVAMKHGPAFSSIFGNRSLVRVKMSGQIHWHNAFGNNTTDRQGVAGFFGLQKDNGSKYVGLSQLNTEAKTTSDSGNTTNTGKHAITAGTEFIYDSNHVVFQRNGVAPPPSQTPVFETNRDINVYPDTFDTRGEPRTYLHIDEFSVLGAPYMISGGNNVVNIKFIAAQNKVDFRGNYSANRRLAA